jgi:acyl carrier protein
MSEHDADNQQGDSDKKGEPRERTLDENSDVKKKDRIYDDLLSMVTNLIEVSPTDITPESDIIFDLGLDSLQLYELVVDLEDGYDIRLPDEELEKIHSVQDIVDLVFALAR